MHSSRPRDVLARPLLLAAIALLALNDHALKEAFPGLVTGKLSDVAGLFAFPLVAWASLDAFGARPATRTLARIAAFTTGLFAALKLVPPVRAGWEAAYAALLWPTRVAPDPTDLLCLPLCWAAWRFGRWHLEQPPLSVRRQLGWSVRTAVIGLFATLTVATSQLLAPRPLKTHVDARVGSNLVLKIDRRIYRDKPLELTLAGPLQQVTIVTRAHALIDCCNCSSAEGELSVWVVREWTSGDPALEHELVRLAFDPPPDGYLPIDPHLQLEPPSDADYRYDRAELLPICGSYQVQAIDAEGTLNRIDLSFAVDHEAAQ